MNVEVPDVYSDQFLLLLSPYGATFGFSASGVPIGRGQVSPQQPVLTLRMSLEHAKAMSQIIRTELRKYEGQVIKCPIPLPQRDTPPIEPTAEITTQSSTPSEPLPQELVVPGL